MKSLLRRLKNVEQLIEREPSTEELEKAMVYIATMHREGSSLPADAELWMKSHSDPEAASMTSEELFDRFQEIAKGINSAERVYV